MQINLETIWGFKAQGRWQITNKKTIRHTRNASNFSRRCSQGRVSFSLKRSRRNLFREWTRAFFCQKNYAVCCYCEGPLVVREHTKKPTGLCGPFSASCTTDSAAPWRNQSSNVPFIRFKKAIHRTLRFL